MYEQPGNSSKELEITFPGDIDVTESLQVIEVSPGLYRLEQSSVPGEVFYGDVIELSPSADGAHRFVRVVSRSGLHVSTFILTASVFASEDLNRFLKQVQTAGGAWERTYGGVLFIHLPPDSSVDVNREMQPFMSAASAQVAPPIATASVPPPARDPVWSGWDVLLLAFLILVCLFVAESLTVLAAWMFVYSGTPFRYVMQKPVLDLLGEILGYIAVALYMVMLVEGKYHVPFWKAIRWNWSGKAAPKLLGLGVLTVGLDLLGRYLPMPKTTPFEQFFAHPTDAYLMAAFAISFGPLMEELFFRGFLYPVLERRTGMAMAVLLTALPFGLMHYVQYRSWGAVLVITAVGVVLTLVRVATQSVAASFLVHVGYNATLMVLTAVATDGFRHMEKMT